MILRKAKQTDLPFIWKIIQQAIERRKQDGSNQWQNGYPNLRVLQEDIDKGWGAVMIDNDEVIIAYAAIIFDVEPVYNDIQGKWLTNGDYVVVHRVATSNLVKGKGVATKLFEMIEDWAKARNVFSIKVDTNFDNAPMLHIVDKLGYSYCGEVYFRGSARRAYEKVLSKD